jgi:hypothetical protein
MCSLVLLSPRSIFRMSGWWSRNRRCGPPQVLSDGGQNKLVLSASWATQSQPTEL